MRVAYVCADPGIPVFGCKGASVHVQSVVRALTRRGGRVTLLAPRIGGPAPPGLEDIELIRLPRAPQGDLPARERIAEAANADLTAALTRSGPFDLIYERYSLWSFAGMEYARAMGLPGLLEVNAPLIEEQATHRALADRDRAEAIAGRAFRAASAMLAVSREVAGYLEARSAATGRVHFVPNGVDPERFPAGIRPARPAAPGVVSIGFLGSLKPWHDLDTLAEAFGLLHTARPATRLVLVGDGGERDRLLAALAARGAGEATIRAGAVPPEEVPAWLASMDIGVAPYAVTASYFSPLKVFEYMAAGLAVVASQVGQVAEVIQDGETGLLCPPGDAGALAATLSRLCDDPGLRHRLGERARAVAFRDHTWDTVADQILDLANRLRTVTAGIEA